MIIRGSMEEYKVLIPSAGLGTRLGEFSKNLNKALVALDNKPVISHVIEKFPKSVEIVVALGHKKKELRDYLELAYPDRKITCVDIENFSGPGSGLGLTIMECKEHLQCPFVFCSNDTVVLEEVPPPKTEWIAYSNLQKSSNYRSLKIDDEGLVEKICEKGELYSFETRPYIGLAGINDYKTFWKSMEEGRKYGSIEIGESYSLRKFVEEDSRRVEARKFTWFDTGNLESLKEAKKAIKQDNAPEILEKANEAIWFVNGHVIKYNSDKQFISDRILRSRELRGFVPEILSSRENMYVYKMIAGKTLSKTNNRVVFEKFLKFIKNFWKEKKLTPEEEIAFKDKCMEFYRDKTYKRIDSYCKRFSYQDCEENINGKNISEIYDILEKVDWDNLSDGIPTKFHGDLHFENILVAETGEFCLLDWRQNFSGIIGYGDVYYDLAKLMHGMIMSHELVNKECYFTKKRDNIIEYDFYMKNSLVEDKKDFVNFLRESGYNIKKVEILTALIFLNIAALHHYPYSELLFYLGKTSLSEALK